MPDDTMTDGNVSPGNGELRPTNNNVTNVSFSLSTSVGDEVSVIDRSSSANRCEEGKIVVKIFGNSVQQCLQNCLENCLENCMQNCEEMQRGGLWKLLIF